MTLTKHDFIVDGWYKALSSNAIRRFDVNNENGYFKWNGYFWHDLNMMGSVFGDVEPVNLTPEILLKNGFEQAKGHGIITFVKDNFSILVLNDNGDCLLQFWYKSDWHESKMIPCAETKYVHNLQNAYRLATGEQIEIKL